MDKNSFSRKTDKSAIYKRGKYRSSRDINKTPNRDLEHFFVNDIQEYMEDSDIQEELRGNKK